jgi:hypothetical protein
MNLQVQIWGVTGENEQPRGENVDYTRSLSDLFALVATNSPSCIVLPPTNATHFDLKLHVIQLLPSFYGLDLDRRLFPFSLHERAKAWLDSNMPESITSWENMGEPVEQVL